MSEIIAFVLLLVFLVLALVFVVAVVLYMLSALGLITVTMAAIWSILAGSPDNSEAEEADA
ncbi:MAG: hypothetical protein JSW46_04725 [Gemmatimonadota bacterium]|nr:MAG: hypothetical protein JSW46_04725 [Gemmatimonadota bacterium]